MKQVSVIIPFYNCRSTLERCISSVLAQSYRNIEVLLLDDSSTDDSASIAGRFAQLDERVRFFTFPHGGESAMRNKGIELSAGDYIAFVDGDDYVEPGYVAGLVKAAQMYDCPMAACGYYVRGVDMKAGPCHSGDSKGHTAFSAIKNQADLHRYYLTKGSGSSFAWGKLYGRELFNGLAYPEGRAYPDIALLPYILEAAGSCAFVDLPLYDYCLNEGGITLSAPLRLQYHGLKARLDNIKFYRKHYGHCPEYTRFARERAIDYSCYLMGKIVGITNSSRKIRRLSLLIKNLCLENPYSSLTYIVLGFLVYTFPVFMAKLFFMYSMCKSRWIRNRF